MSYRSLPIGNLSNTNITFGSGIQSDASFSYVSVNCDPKVVLPRTSVTDPINPTRDMPKRYQGDLDIAGKIAVERDICNLEVTNLKVTGTLIIENEPVFKSCVTIALDGRDCCPLTVKNTDPTDAQSSNALCVIGPTNIDAPNATPSTSTVTGFPLLTVDAQNLQKDTVVSQIILGAGTNDASINTGIGLLINGNRGHGLNTDVGAATVGNYMLVNGDGETGIDEAGPTAYPKSRNNSLAINQMDASLLSDNISKREGRWSDSTGPNFSSGWWSGGAFSKEAQTRQMSHQVTSVGRINQPGLLITSNASNTIFTLKDAFSQSATRNLPMTLGVTGVDSQSAGGDFFVGSGLGTGTVDRRLKDKSVYTFQLNKEKVVSGAGQGSPIPVLIDLVVEKDRIVSACLRQTSLEQGSLNEILTDQEYFIPCYEDMIQPAANGPGPFPIPALVEPQGQLGSFANGYWPPNVNTIPESPEAAYWAGVAPSGEPLPIIVLLDGDATNPTGTLTIAGGLTIGAPSGTSAGGGDDLAVSRFQSKYPVNHIHSIGPSPSISFVSGNEATSALTEGLAVRLLNGSTDVCGVIELAFIIPAGGPANALPFAGNPYAPSFFQDTFPGPPDLLEIKYNTPYLQRMKNGVPSVIIQPDANLARFGFTLAPMFRQSDAPGGNQAATPGQNFYSWAQPGQQANPGAPGGAPQVPGSLGSTSLFTNSTLSNPMDGFVIVGTNKAPVIDNAQVPATGTTFFGYIRYQVMTHVEQPNGGVENPPKPGAIGFPFTNA